MGFLGGLSWVGLDLTKIYPEYPNNPGNPDPQKLIIINQNKSPGPQFSYNFSQLASIQCPTNILIVIPFAIEPIAPLEEIIES